MNDLKFEVFNNRKGTFVTYNLEKTDAGWNISHIAINGKCEPSGQPLLHLNLNQDYISYPKQIDLHMEELWSEIDEGEITEDLAQKKLQAIADWITLCEKNRPEF